MTINNTCKKWLILFVVLLLLICISSNRLLSRAHISINDPELFFAQYDERKLFEFMSKSRYWKVSHTGDKTYASMRYNLWKENYPLQDSQTTVQFYFLNKQDYGVLPYNAVQVTDKDNGNIPLRLLWDDGYDSFLKISFCTGAYLVIHEIGKTRKRIGTQHVLDYLGRIIKSKYSLEMLDFESSVHCGGQTNLVSDVAIKNSEFPTGCGSVSGWINCLLPGSIEILVKDMESGKTLNEKKMFETNEFVGWDSNIYKKFYFESELCVDGDGQFRNVTFDIVFTPMLQGVERTVFSTNTVVRTWIR